MNRVGSKLRILCLHGYRQDGETFSKRIGAFRKRMKAVAEFHYLDGSQVVVPGDESGIAEEEGRAGGRGWWFSRDDDYFKAVHYSDYVKGFEESVSSVEHKLCEAGPFDGVFGFSQGATLAAIMCVLKERGQLKPEANFRFVILVSAFKSRCSPHSTFYTDPIATPSLHVIGDGDKIVDHTISEELAAMFSDSTTLRHDGGHFVPVTAELAPLYKTFLARFTNVPGSDEMGEHQALSGEKSSDSKKNVSGNINSNKSDMKDEKVSR